MTKINKKQQGKNVQMHNGDVVFEMLDKYLPDTYAPEAVRRLLAKGLIVSKDVVRNVRHKRGSAFKNQTLAVLLEMATEEKLTIDTLNATQTK